LRNWRNPEWKPALEAAGLARERRPYDLRHSGISWMLAAGLPTLDVARFAGTSTRMIDNVYGHLVKGSEASARQRLDAFANSERLGQEWATP
jgi:integrase